MQNLPLRNLYECQKGNREDAEELKSIHPLNKEKIQYHAFYILDISADHFYY